MLNVTAPAIDKFKQLLAEKGLEGGFVNLAINGFGWGGPQFVLALVESVNVEEATVEEIDGLKLAYDRSVSTYLEGKIIDYQPSSHGFTITDKKFSPGMSKGGC